MDSRQPIAEKFQGNPLQVLGSAYAKNVLEDASVGKRPQRLKPVTGSAIKGSRTSKVSITPDTNDTTEPSNGDTIHLEFGFKTAVMSGNNGVLSMGSGSEYIYCPIDDAHATSDMQGALLFSYGGTTPTVVLGTDNGGVSIYADRGIEDRIDDGKWHKCYIKANRVDTNNYQVDIYLDDRHIIDVNLYSASSSWVPVMTYIEYWMAHGTDTRGTDAICSYVHKWMTDDSGSGAITELLHWSFDEGVGSYCYDLSGNDNKGTITNIQSDTWESEGGVKCAANDCGYHNLSHYAGTWRNTATDTLKSYASNGYSFGVTFMADSTGDQGIICTDGLLGLRLTTAANRLQFLSGGYSDGVTATLSGYYAPVGSLLTVVCSVDSAGNITYIIDPDTVETDTMSTPGFNASEWNIGCRNSGLQKFNGGIAHACFFDEAMDVAELKELWARIQNDTVRGHSAFSTCDYYFRFQPQDRLNDEGYYVDITDYGKHGLSFSNLDEHRDERRLITPARYGGTSTAYNGKASAALKRVKYSAEFVDSPCLTLDGSTEYASASVGTLSGTLGGFDSLIYIDTSNDTGGDAGIFYFGRLNGLEVTFIDTGNDIRFEFGSTTVNVDMATNGINFNEWFRLTFLTSNGGNYQIYINDNLVDSGTADTGTVDNNVYIGRNNSSQYCAMRIAYLQTFYGATAYTSRIFEKGKENNYWGIENYKEGQLPELFNNTACYTYWTFQEADGSTVYDVGDYLTSRYDLTIQNYSSSVWDNVQDYFHYNAIKGYDVEPALDFGQGSDWYGDNVETINNIIGNNRSFIVEFVTGDNISTYQGIIGGLQGTARTDFGCGLYINAGNLTAIQRTSNKGWFNNSYALSANTYYKVEVRATYQIGYAATDYDLEYIINDVVVESLVEQELRSYTGYASNKHWMGCAQQTNPQDFFKGKIISAYWYQDEDTVGSFAVHHIINEGAGARLIDLTGNGNHTLLKSYATQYPTQDILDNIWKTKEGRIPALYNDTYQNAGNDNENSHPNPGGCRLLEHVKIKPNPYNAPGLSYLGITSDFKLDIHAPWIGPNFTATEITANPNGEYPRTQRILKNILLFNEDPDLADTQYGYVQKDFAKLATHGVNISAADDQTYWSEITRTTTDLIYDAEIVSNRSMNTKGYFQALIGDGDSGAIQLHNGSHTFNDDRDADYFMQMPEVAGSLEARYAGEIVMASTPLALAENDVLRLRAQRGRVYYEYSTDNGVTWTLFYVENITPTFPLWGGGINYNNGDIIMKRAIIVGDLIDNPSYP